MATRKAPTPFDSVSYEDFDPQLNSSYNFENYCLGESNRLPYTIADFIANHPEKNDFNPFFLYGNVGVGKTHLIQAIGIRIKEQFPRAKVLYVPVRHFQNQVSIANIKGKVPDFLNWYQHLDVLLMDDLQELTTRGTMDLLFPIFNHLHLQGKKLIFTCDRAPYELDGLTDRLIDRFKWGVTEQLPKPDLELRKKILHSKALKNGLTLSEDVLNVIAEDVTGSVRELEGIVMGIITHSIALNCPITVELAREVMKHSMQTRKKIINFDMIVEATADFYNLNPDVIFSKSRLRDIADARQVIMYLANKLTGLSSPAIGQKLNRRHATVLYGIKTIKDRIPFSKDLSDAVEGIESVLKK
jgi:chromosomal replication initiator protein